MPWFALAALVIYLALASLACFSRRVGSGTPHPVAEIALLSLGLLLHGAAIFNPFVHPELLHFGASEALSLTAWLSLAIYLTGQLVWRVQAPLTMLITLAALFLLAALILPSGPALDYKVTTLARGHLLLAMLAYGMLTNAAAVALLMRLADRRLHHLRANTLLHALPPLLTLEKLLFLCLWLGFSLLTLVLASGILFSEQTWGHPLELNHKTFFSVVAWLIFGGLLAGRALRGWRGRFAANWTLAGYLLLFLGYIGTQFVLEIILHRV
ncbi:MAG: cytochrome c biogenesis protein CcsA [Formivibrio sp.]|nr:cytochrome c biogenesis protein CcsA [Formivibrio sp.]